MRVIVVSWEKHSKTVAEFLASNGVPSMYYTSKTPKTDKIRTMSGWEKGNIRFLVGTSSVGAGLNLPGVQAIIHACQPYSAMDTLQKRGHCYRVAGLQGTVHFLICQDLLCRAPYSRELHRIKFFTED